MEYVRHKRRRKDNLNKRGEGEEGWEVRVWGQDIKANYNGRCV